MDSKATFPKADPYVVAALEAAIQPAALGAPSPTVGDTLPRRLRLHRVYQSNLLGTEIIRAEIWGRRFKEQMVVL